MLEFIRIQNFKILLDASFSLATLNLFSGLNGMGKSSLIQTLLLLRQSYERNTLFGKGLLLNGDYIALGTGQDILSENFDIDSIAFLLKWAEKEALNVSFKYVSQSDLQPIEELANFSSPETVNLFNRNFQYLSAERVIPKSVYNISDYHIHTLNSLGNHGEYTAHFIAENTNKQLSIPKFKHDRSVSLSLLENLNHWMSEISPGINIHTMIQQQVNAVSLNFAFTQGSNRTANFKPQNVGFGLTYVLPVITAILRSKPGDLLIIENPESHLHPAGQALIGRMCALAASNGVQLFIETHSDHFLNGVRVAVKEKIIPHDNVKLFYLERDISSSIHASTVKTPQIDENGRLDFWPAGFFDEWNIQLEKLL